MITIRLSCLFVLAVAWGLPGAVVANETPGTATTLSVGGTGTGYVNHDTDPQDWWVVTASSLGDMQFVLQVPSDQDFDLRVYNSSAPDGFLGGSYKGSGQTETVRVTMTYSGPYYAKVTTFGDSSGNYTLRNSIITGPAPDPAVQSVSLTNHTFDPGDPISIGNRIRNQGEQTSAGYRIEFFVSTDAWIDDGDTSLGHVNRGALAPGAEHNYRTQAYLPSSLADGTYYVGVLLTGTNDAVASNNRMAADDPIQVISTLSEFGGVVTDAMSGRPIAGAAVSWGSDTATTDSNGRYLFAGVPCQTRTLTVSSAGYLTSSQSYAPVCWACSVKDVALSPDITAFGGIVSNRWGGEVIAGATVTWGPHTATTGSDGRYWIDGIACGTHTLRITHPNYGTYSATYTPACFASNLRSAGLIPNISEFGGVVRDRETGNPIPGVQVTWGDRVSTSDTRGVYHFTEVPCESRTLAISGHPVYRDVSDSHSPACLASSIRNIDLDPREVPYVSNVRAAQREGRKLVDVYYDLNTWGRDVSVSAQVSTNGGASFDLPAEAWSGSGFGADVRPGDNRLLVWSAGADWSNRVSSQVRIRVQVETFHGSYFATSGVIAVDTRDGDLPMIEDLVFAHGNELQHAYYLEDVPLPVTFQATVNWNGHEPGYLSFHYPRGGQVGLATSMTLDVGAQLEVGDGLFVSAVSADGVESSPYRANFDVIPVPLDIPAVLFEVDDDAEGLRYAVNSFVLDLMSEGVDAIPSDNDGESIPGFGGQAFRVGVEVATRLMIHGDGTAFGQTFELYNNQFDVAGFDVAPRVTGAFRMTYDPGRVAWIPTGEIRLDATATFSTPPAYIWSTPPIYLRGDIKVTAGAELAVIDWLPDGRPELRGGLPVEAMASFVAGCGASGVAGVEGYVGGRGMLDLQFPQQPHLRELSVGLQGGVRVVFLFWSWEQGLLDYSWSLYEANALSRLAPLGVPAMLNHPDFDQFELMPRVGRKLPRRTLSFQPGEALIAAPVFAYASPKLVGLGQDRSLFRLYDDPTRLAENRTLLVMSEHDGGAWTGLEVIDDDGTADFAPDAAAFPSGERLVVWANVNTVLTNGAGLDEAFAGLEIASAVVGTDGTVRAVTHLTTNTWLDHQPKLSAGANGEAWLTWIANRDNLPHGGAGSASTLWAARWTGSAWDAPVALATNLPMTLWHSLAFNGSLGAALVTVDLDDDQATVADQEIWGGTFDGTNWSPIVRRTDNTVQDANPQTVYDPNGRSVVVWQHGSNLVLRRNDLELDAHDVVGTVGDATSARDFKLFAGGDGRISAVWSDLADDGTGPHPFLIQYDPWLGVWSRPQQLFSDGHVENGFSPLWLADGSLCMAYTKTEVTLSTNHVPTLGMTYLMEYARQPELNLGLEAGSLAVVPAEPVPGSNLTVSVTVRNFGDWAATAIPVRVMAVYGDGSEEQVEATQTVAQLAAGAAGTVSVAWTVPTNQPSITLRAEVDPAYLLADANRADNTLTHDLLRSRVALADAWALHATPTNRLLYARVTQKGVVPADASFGIEFRLGSATGAVIGRRSVSNLPSGGSLDVGADWVMEPAGFTSAYVTVAAVLDGSAYPDAVEEGSAEAYLQVMTPLDTDGDGLLDGEEERRGSSPLLADTDGDGLSDPDELQIWNTDPANPDHDGDGVSDYDETQAATDPRDGAHFLAVHREDASGLTCIRWMGEAGVTYQVRRSTNLVIWTDAPDTGLPHGTSRITAMTNGPLVYCGPRHEDDRTSSYGVRVETDEPPPPGN